MSQKDLKYQRNKKKARPEVSEINPVPLYRSYGVTKKETIFTRINEVIATVLEWLLYITYIIMIVIGTLFMIKLGGALAIVCVFIPTVLFVFFVLARKKRKRAKFLSKMKRQCRRFGYTLEKKRSFLKGLKFNKKGIDFIVHTPTKKWIVRFMTPRKKKCHITFLNKETIEIKTIKRQIKLRLGIFGSGDLDTGRNKVRFVSYSFDDSISFDNIEAQKVLLINPVPLEMFKTEGSGSRIPIGTGERLYDYIMYSGTGFINTLEREYNEKNGEQ